MLLVSRGRPATAVGGLLLAEVVPAFIGPMLGALVDRIDRRRTMIACEAGQAVVYAAIAIWLPPYAGILALVGIATLMSRTFSSASKSAIASLVERDELMSANALINTVFNLQVALGPALGGLLVAFTSSRLALSIDAGSFLASAVIMLGLPRIPRAVPVGEVGGLLAETREGLVYVWRDPLLRVLAITMFAFVAAASLDNVTVVFLVRDVLHHGSVAFGAAMSAFGLGMIIGALGLVRRWSGVHPAMIVSVGMLFTGSGNLLVGLSPAIGFVMAFQLLGGIGNGIQLVGEDTLVQRHVPEHLLGRAFAAIATSIFLGSTIAYALGGVLVDSTSPRTALVVSGITVFAVAAWSWPALRRVAARDRAAETAEGSA